MLISGVVLYETAAPGEKRPFPKQILFTGWFDTGKQGQEWPGDFEIVPHEKPLTWKAARSVKNAGTGESWIRLSLRGKRRLNTVWENELFFRYHLTGADRLTIQLREPDSTIQWNLTDLKQNEWSESTSQFHSRHIPTVDEIRFLVPKGGRLTIDDLLLYAP